MSTIVAVIDPCGGSNEPAHIIVVKGKDQIIQSILSDEAFKNELNECKWVLDTLDSLEEELELIYIISNIGMDHHHIANYLCKNWAGSTVPVPIQSLRIKAKPDNLFEMTVKNILYETQ
jgi:hypothetical protein